jgi:hypothetical protein
LDEINYGNWELGIGHWALGIGNWKLIIDYFLLVTPFRKKIATRDFLGLFRPPNVQGASL